MHQVVVLPVHHQVAQHGRLHHIVVDIKIETLRQLFVFKDEVLVIHVIDDRDRIVVDQSLSSLNANDRERHPDDAVLTDPDVGFDVTHFASVAQHHPRLALKILEIDLLDGQL